MDRGRFGFQGEADQVLLGYTTANEPRSPSARLRGGPSERTSAGASKNRPGLQVKRVCLAKSRLCVFAVTERRIHRSFHPDGGRRLTIHDWQHPIPIEVSGTSAGGGERERKGVPSQHFHRAEVKNEKNKSERNFENSSYPDIFRDGTKTNQNKPEGKTANSVW